MVTLNRFIRELMEAQGEVAPMLDGLRLAKERDLPLYRERFHARVPDPGKNLRHCALQHIAFLYVETPSAFRDAWSALRQLGKSGVYSDEDVDKQIDIMLSDLDQIEAEIRRIPGFKD